MSLYIALLETPKKIDRMNPKIIWCVTHLLNTYLLNIYYAPNKFSKCFELFSEKIIYVSAQTKFIF